MNKQKKQKSFKKYIIVFVLIILFQVFGIILPKLLIKDTINYASADFAKREAKINYFDNPIIKFLTIETKAYKNELKIINVGFYTFFGYKIGNVELMPDGSSHANWF